MDELINNITNYCIPGSNKILCCVMYGNEEDDKDSNEINDDANKSERAFQAYWIFYWALQNDKYTNLLNEDGVVELDTDSLKIQLEVNSDDSIK